MIYRVNISENALEAMTIAAIEAYLVGDGRNKELETYGYVYGFRTSAGNQTRILVDRMHVSTSAKKTTDYVIPNETAEKLVHAILQRRSPHLLYLGDFHTHPYGTLKKVNKISGYEFSPPDLESFPNLDFLWEQSDDNPIMLVMTICKLRRVARTGGEFIRPNIWQFNVGEFRLWLNVVVGFESGIGRDHTGNNGNGHDRAFLDMDSLFYNERGERLLPPRR